MHISLFASNTNEKINRYESYELNQNICEKENEIIRKREEEKVEALKKRGAAFSVNVMEHRSTFCTICNFKYKGTLNDHINTT